MVQQNGQIVGYVRVSSQDQNLARQLEALGPVDRLFQDQLSGKSRAPRTGLADCLAYVRDGDTVRVASMDRLARSLVDLQQIVDDFTAKGAAIEFLKERLTFSPSGTDPFAVLQLQILGAVAEFERKIIHERQAEGIALAKQAGKYKGRSIALTPAQVEHARTRIEAGVPKTKVAKDLGINRSTLYRSLERAAEARESADD